MQTCIKALRGDNSKSNTTPSVRLKKKALKDSVKSIKISYTRFLL